MAFKLLHKKAWLGNRKNSKFFKLLYSGERVCENTRGLLKRFRFLGLMETNVIVYELLKEGYPNVDYFEMFQLLLLV